MKNAIQFYLTKNESTKTSIRHLKAVLKKVRDIVLFVCVPLLQLGGRIWFAPPPPAPYFYNDLLCNGRCSVCWDSKRTGGGGEGGGGGQPYLGLANNFTKGLQMTLLERPLVKWRLVTCGSMLTEMCLVCSTYVQNHYTRYIHYICMHRQKNI